MEKLERNDSKINLKIQLKSAVTKKLRLRIWGIAYNLAGPLLKKLSVEKDDVDDDDDNYGT